MATATDPLQTALAHHRAGQLDAAEKIYRQLLQADPRHAGAMHLLGLVALQRGRFPTAVEQISQAIRWDGSQAAFHANLGEAYRGLGDLAQARACYEQALVLKPEMAEARNNLGTILQAAGQVAEAIASYRHAIALNPIYADAYNNLGTAHQDLGDWPEATDCYRHAVGVAPQYAKGYYNLGNALARGGELEAAQQALRVALELNSNDAAAHAALAATLLRQQKPSEAEAAYRQAVRLQPGRPETWCGLGVACQSQDKLPEAIEAYRQALRVQVDFAEGHYNLGTALKAQNQLAEAEASYRRAVECRPNFAEAHYNHGTVLQQLGRLEEAAAAYREAIRLRPDDALAHNNLGNIYKMQGDTQRAVECYEHALRIVPEQGEALNNLGILLQSQGKLDETVECYVQAARAKTDSAEVYNNLGTAWQENGQLSKALASYEKSLQLKPDFPEARYNRALVYLSQGRFSEAWSDYAWRLKAKKYPTRDFGRPLWDGAPLAGRTLLIYAEQGFGDTLHFVRYIEHARRCGGTIKLEVQPRLVPLLQSSGYHEALAAGSDLGHFDLQVPLLDLPGVFGTTLENMPADVPYLLPSAKLVEQWREYLSRFAGLKIGIHWQGNPNYAFDRHRSIPLKSFAPLAAVPGVQLFSLQRDDGARQIGQLTEPLKIHEFPATFDTEAGAFMDTAAVMSQLDLVITSDTSTAHLAGALGVHVWVALGMLPEWRWFLEREDSPWYPTMRLFRQATLGDWQTVFERIAERLASLVPTDSAGDASSTP